MKKNYGIKSLKKTIKKDCNESGYGCFSETGCTKLRYNNFHNGETILKYSRAVPQCPHGYCDKYKWIIDRAKYYAILAGTTKEKVLEAWERNRTYWYMEYYQECNFPKIKADIIGDKFPVIDKESISPDTLKAYEEAMRQINKEIERTTIIRSRFLGNLKFLQDKLNKKR